MDSKQTYELNLSNRTRWRIEAESDYNGWFRELARIMRMEPGSDQNHGNGIRIVSLTADAIRDTAGFDTAIDIELGTALRLHVAGDYTRAVVGLEPELLSHPDIRYISMWWALRPIQLHALMTGGGPFHAVLAELNGNGVLIAGPSGSGKSTCFNRFPDYWNPLSDDQVIAVRELNGSYSVHPFPTWSEYLGKTSSLSWNVGEGVPLKAAFFLQQSTQDFVNPIPSYRAAKLLLGAHEELWERFTNRIDAGIAREQRLAAFENTCQMARNIPCYFLGVSLNGRFWEKIEDVMASDRRYDPSKEDQSFPQVVG